MVLFAVPKKGRLLEEVMKLLKGSGLDAKRPERLDVAMCSELPVKLVFLPAADIPQYVIDGNVDLGISGGDMLEETLLGEGLTMTGENLPVQVLSNLGMGKCKLCLQAPKLLGSTDAADFVGKRIVTSFPNITRRFFDNIQGESTEKTVIKVVSGSVEAACGLGLADAVVDLVETGTTMRAAGLEVVTSVLETEALLFQQVHKEGTPSAKAETISLIKQRISGYLTSTRYIMIVYNCQTADLVSCCKLTPGKRSPTITPLKEEGWHSVSALVSKQQMNATMDELLKHGASDILCFSLTSTRM